LSNRESEINEEHSNDDSKHFKTRRQSLRTTTRKLDELRRRSRVKKFEGIASMNTEEQQ